MAEQITIISDLLKRDPAYQQVINQLEERLYNRYMIYLADKPKFNEKTSVIPKPYLAQIISFKNTLELNKIAKKYNLTQEQRDGIPNILWKIFYREAEIKNLPQMINSELSINNIKTSYQISADIANLYMPISDFLGDISMVIKKWQYEMPVSEPSISELITKPTAKPQLTPTATPQPMTPILQAEPAPITPPPIRPTPIEQALKIPALQTTPQVQQDESIPKVQETLSRIAAASNRITEQIQRQAQESAIEKPPMPVQQPISQPTQQTIVTQTGHISDLEPEYLPDEPAKPVNKANVIDLKNF